MTPQRPSTNAITASRIDGRSPLQRRRRETTRFEIAEAAVELFIDQGFDATTVDQIARAAGISLRTFYRHCDSKDDVLTPVLTTGGDRFVELLAGAPSERPLAEVVISSAIAVMEDHDRPQLRRDASRIMFTTPALRQRWLSLIRVGQVDLAPVLADRFGWQPDSLAASAMAALIITAVNSAVEHSLRTDAPLADTIRESVTMLDAGLGTVHQAAHVGSR